MILPSLRFDGHPGASVYEMGSARQKRFKPAAGGRFDVAVVDVGKLLLLAPIRRPEVLLPTKANRKYAALLCGAGDREVRSSEVDGVAIIVELPLPSWASDFADREFRQNGFEPGSR